MTPTQKRKHEAQLVEQARFAREQNAALRQEIEDLKRQNDNLRNLASRMGAERDYAVMEMKQHKEDALAYEGRLESALDALYALKRVSLMAIQNDDHTRSLQRKLFSEKQAALGGKS